MLFAGLTKREYFAGLAMQGLMVDVGRGSSEQWDAALMAKNSVRGADALIAELSKAEGESK